MTKREKTVAEEKLQKRLLALDGRKGGLKKHRSKLEKDLTALKAQKARLERELAETLADPDHDPENVAELKKKLASISVEIPATEKALAEVDKKLEAIEREIAEARRAAEEEERLQHELRYIESAKELERRIPEVARLAADAIMALHNAYPKTGASWAAPEGFANSLLKSLGFALIRELRHRDQTGLAAVAQIQCGTFASPPPRPLHEAFVSKMSLSQFRKQAQKKEGDGNENPAG